MNAIEQLKAVLCDPEGKCCIAGSDEDRAIVDRALQALAQPEQERYSKKELAEAKAWAEETAKVLNKPEQEPVVFGAVTVRRLSQRIENHHDQYQFYPAGQSPYLDNVDECYTVYTTPPQRKPQNGIATEVGIAWQAGAFGTTRTAVTVEGRSWYRDDDPKVAQRKPLTREIIERDFHGRVDFVRQVEAAHEIKE